jgi:superfamily II DNA/RNA helicase
LTSFADLGVSARTLAALERQSITDPLPVQAESIPWLLQGRDLVIAAPTGSGKTLAFLAPMLELLGDAPAAGPRALVVTPTRELAVQIDAVFTSLGSPLRRALLYGGIGYATQTLDLKRGVDVVIGTPGRILDMIGRKLLSLSRVEYLVLDEADEMFDAGFAPDVERLIGLTYEPQTVLASATMPSWVDTMIQRHLHDPVRVEVQRDEESLLEHGLVRVETARKLDTLSRLLHGHKGAAIVFGRTKHGVKKLNRMLKQMGHDSLEIQGNLSQSARDRTMESFRQERADILVATNVAARGLDISHVGLVVNYELPESPHLLTHRIGRTARNGASGRALTFVTPEDHAQWSKLRRQGAPPLLDVDLARLLSGEGWRLLDAAEQHPRVGWPDQSPIRSGAGRRRGRRNRFRGGSRSPQPAT